MVYKNTACTTSVFWSLYLGVRLVGKLMVVLFTLITLLKFSCPFWSRVKFTAKLYINYVPFEFLSMFPLFCIYAILYVA